jgi:hypothetical protein
VTNGLEMAPSPPPPPPPQQQQQRQQQRQQKQHVNDEFQVPLAEIADRFGSVAPAVVADDAAADGGMDDSDIITVILAPPAQGNEGARAPETDAVAALAPQIAMQPLEPELVFLKLPTVHPGPIGHARLTTAPPTRDSLIAEMVCDQDSVGTTEDDSDQRAG